VVKCLRVSKADGAEKLTRKITDGLTEEIKGIGGGGMPVTKVVEQDGGAAFSTGVAKFIQPVCGPLCERLGAEPGDVLFFGAGSFETACKHLDYARSRLIELLELEPARPWDLLWVVDFPMFVWDADDQRFYSTHHPFTAPRDEDVHLLDSDPGKVRAKAYDLVLNGTEMAGGSVRIHQRAVQQQVFKLLGISDEEAHEKFAFLMEALRFGPPPHGGIAFGLDRWVMMLGMKESLRDVIAYPKTQRAVCPLTSAPGPVADEQLRELGIDLRPEVRARLTAGSKAPDEPAER
jgi:aspartyl-tRNA synthetase